MFSQELLFSEPSIAETGVWCTLRDGIDPADWALLCRYIANMEPKTFYRILSELKNNSRQTRTPAVSTFTSEEIPLVSIGPSGVNGAYQREF